MSVTSILRDLQNNVSIVRMTVTDTLATVTSTDYILDHQDEIDALNNGHWEWFTSDFLAIAASDGNLLAVFEDDTFATLADIASIGSAVTAADIQQQAFTYAVASGAANNYNVTLSPAPAAYTDGMYVAFRSITNNSGASAANVNSLGPKAIVTNDNVALAGGEILNGGDYLLIYNSSFGKFVLINSSAGGGGTVTEADIQQQAFTYAVDSGVADAYVITLSPAPSGYTDGMVVCFQPTNTNTTGSTIDVNGLGAKSIINMLGSNLLPGELIADLTYTLVYDVAAGGVFVLQNSSLYATPRRVLQQTYTYAVDTGAANAYVVTLGTIPTGYTDGMYVAFKATNPNSGASTIDVNSLGAKDIVDNANTALASGAILDNGTYLLQYNSTFGKFVLVNSSAVGGGGVTEADIQNQAFTYAVDTGAANAYVVTLSPAPASYTDGMYVAFKATNPNSAASTIDVNGLGAKSIVDNDNAALVANAILDNASYLLQYNSTFGKFVLINPSPATLVTKTLLQRPTPVLAFDSSSTADLYTAVLDPDPGGTLPYWVMLLFAHADNTGGCNLQINSNGPTQIVDNAGNNLTAGMIKTNGSYLFLFSVIAGISCYQLVNPSA